MSRGLGDVYKRQNIAKTESKIPINRSKVFAFFHPHTIPPKKLKIIAPYIEEALKEVSARFELIHGKIDKVIKGIAPRYPKICFVWNDISKFKKEFLLI